MNDQPENDGPYQDAQSAGELERYVMNSTSPKTPAEWWARGEIESLRARIAELEVLKPFADVYVGDHVRDTAKIYDYLTIGHIRAASAALEKKNAD